MRRCLTRRSVRLPQWGLPTVRRCAALACAAALGLAGCTLGPDYKRPEMPLPSAWRAEVPESADVVNTAWWEAFGDSDLTALIGAALDANKDLLVATLRIQEYDARLQVSRADNYPQIRGGFSGERQRRSQERPNGLQPGQSPSLNDFDLSATMRWELDLWGRVKRSNEASLADLLANEEARRAVMLSVVSSVATSYLQLLGLDQQLALTRQSLKNRQDALALTDARYRGGSANLLSVVQARSVIDEVTSSIPEIERQIATIENALSTLLGRSPGPIQRQSIDALMAPAVPQGVPSDVLTRRPDVLAAEQQLVAANARIGVAKAAYFPVLSLTGALGLASDDLRYIGEKTARDGNYGAALVAPIFNGGRLEGGVRQSEAVQRRLVVTYQQAVQTALQEVEDALVYRAKSGEQLVSLGRYVDSLREVGQLSRARYTGGQANYLEVLQAELQLYAAQRQQAVSRRDTLLALVAIYKAMGGGWMLEEEKRRAPVVPSPEVQAQATIDAAEAPK